VKCICKWKGTIKLGGIVCGKSAADVEITTDDRVVTCRNCKIILGTKMGKHLHTHLNLHFLKYASINEDEILEFKTYDSKIPQLMCIQNPREIRARLITNDPREITCSHCKRSVWGRKDMKAFILTGLMIEGGHVMSSIRRKMATASNEKLKESLNKLLYGAKV
tara:strand:+ start:871 stop:1362 length:492 start_codon:yes stop_codon:yes gene_type:complete